LKARAKKKRMIVKEVYLEVEYEGNPKTYPYPISEIQNIIKSYYGIQKIDFNNRTRKAEEIQIRQVFQTFVKMYGGFPPHILEAWTNYDRCTYYNSEKRVLGKYSTEPYYREFIDDIDKQIRKELGIEITRINVKILVKDKVTKLNHGQETNEQAAKKRK
jgi:hypothetical protein